MTRNGKKAAPQPDPNQPLEPEPLTLDQQIQQLNAQLNHLNNRIEQLLMRMRNPPGQQLELLAPPQFQITLDTLNQNQQNQHQDLVELGTGLEQLANGLEPWLETAASLKAEQTEQRQTLNSLTKISGNQAEQLTSLTNELHSTNTHLKTLQNALPKKTDFPMRFTLSGETLTYRGIAGYLLIVATYSILLVWVLMHLWPPAVLTRINGRVNNLEIRLDRIEKQRR
jgi:prefoldin subunit 5